MPHSSTHRLRWQRMHRIYETHYPNLQLFTVIIRCLAYWGHSSLSNSTGSHLFCTWSSDPGWSMDYVLSLLAYSYWVQRLSIFVSGYFWTPIKCDLAGWSHVSEWLRSKTIQIMNGEFLNEIRCVKNEQWRGLFYDLLPLLIKFQCISVFRKGGAANRG